MVFFQLMTAQNAVNLKMDLKNSENSGINNLNKGIMRTTTAILCTVMGFIAIPLQLMSIINNQQTTLYILLLILTLPGFINSIIFLYKKYDF